MKTKIETFDTYYGEKLVVKLKYEEGKSGTIEDWVFSINGVEEMSKSKALDYEYGYCILLSEVLYEHLIKRGQVNWLTVGGADYQLMKYQQRFLVRAESDTHLLIDPLAGKLKDFFRIVDKGIEDSPTAREIPLKFSDFMVDIADEYRHTFDVALVDVSDPEVETFLAPNEVYTSKFLEDLSSLMKLDSFVIIYEGENYTLQKEEVEPKKSYIEVPKWFHFQKRVNVGYGFMSLWRLSSQ